MTIKSYMIVTNDDLEIPVKCDLVGAQSVADYLGLSVNRVRKNLCTGIWNHKQKYKAVVDEGGTLEELERRRKQACKYNFLKDRSEYYRQYYRREQRIQEGEEMREILFKAKRKDNGEWVYGNYVFSDTNGEQHFIFQNKAFEHEVDKDTICQYTGLTDKNGNKIWESDIVKYHFGNDVAPIRFGKYQSCFDSTKTAHVGFYVDWDDRTKPLRKDLGYWVNMIDCNVIGNIFDNPELLIED